MSQIWPNWNWATFLPAVCLKENPEGVFTCKCIYLYGVLYNYQRGREGGVGDAVNMRDGPELSYFCYEANF